MSRTPTAFIPHGGGPWPVLALDALRQDETEALASYMRSIGDVAPRPRALLVVSAHWEEEVVTVNAGSSPSMLYDYGGFPPEAYQLQWPAPGSPEVAAEVAELLRGAGIEVAENRDRGFDHGTFIPLMLAYPDADVPTVQLSLQRRLDPGEHLAIGRALAPLRDRGIYILGSGNSFHNLRALFSADASYRESGRAFDAWLNETVAMGPEDRDARLIEWHTAPHAHDCHPREEHLIPLMVVAGAAGDDRGAVQWSGTINGLPISAHHFGA